MLIERALRARGVSMSAKALVSAIQSEYPNELSGKTPWKTLGARLAVDIRRNPESKFLRAGRGLYALREWPDVTEAIVPPRVIHPLDEEILAVPRRIFRRELPESTGGGFYHIPLGNLLRQSVSIQRRAAEQTEEFVQLIPSFVVFREMEVLRFKRTRRTPENRLHDSQSIIFGGHLQAEDIPELFSHDSEILEQFLFREFSEELDVYPPIADKSYLGMIYLQDTAFERQHAGLVFVLKAEAGAIARSLEPGYHSKLEFISWSMVPETPIINDRWSEVIFRLLAEQPGEIV